MSAENESGSRAGSRRLQMAAVALAFVLVAVLHGSNDGLWFGDAPIHAASGLFWSDLLTLRPGHPVDFALRYYARYPVVQPATYPPLFYLLEAAAYAAGGPSPHVAKLVVLPFGIIAGLYTMAWGRRWIAPAAGWTGPFLAFVPGILTWSNAVMLNMPATALGLASLYHFKLWLDTARRRQLAASMLFLAAVLLTYYPGAIVVCLMAGVAAFRWRDIRIDRTLGWIGALALGAALPLAMSIAASPIHTSRHVPSIEFLLRPSTWLLYWWVLPHVIGWPLLLAGAAGAAAGAASARWRREVMNLAICFGALMLVLSLLPARDPRYILLAAPLFLLSSAIGCATVLARRPFGAAPQAIALGAALMLGFWYAARVPVPKVTGFREIAAYLKDASPGGAVLYDGPNSALLAFYVRALDPDFERRITEAGKLLYSYGPGRTFEKWTQTSNVATTGDVVRSLRYRCGCRFVALEAWSQTEDVAGRRLLRAAVTEPEFEFVRSFPIAGVAAQKIDLYRLVEDVEPVTTVDLAFPSFSDREFRSVAPITR